MASGATVELVGLKELMEHLRVRVPEVFAKKIARQSLSAGARIVATAIEALAPIAKAGESDNPGELRNNIAVKILINLENVRASEALIGPGYTGKRTNDPGVYGFFVEEGHRKPGQGVSSRRDYRAIQRKFKTIKAAIEALAYKKEFGAGDTPPHPFVRPAWDMSKAQAYAVMVEQIASGLKELGFKQ